MRWHLAADREHTAEKTVGRDVGADEEFWTTPVGLAARARLRGDHYFQIELDDATLATYAETTPARGGRRVRRTCDLLGQIEELGWQLEHVSWWRVGHDDGQVAVGAHAARPAPGSDHVRGVYLFHSVPDPDAEPALSGAGARAPGHAPQHRRDVT